MIRHEVVRAKLDRLRVEIEAAGHAVHHLTELEFAAASAHATCTARRVAAERKMNEVVEAYNQTVEELGTLPEDVTYI